MNLTEKVLAKHLPIEVEVTPTPENPNWYIRVCSCSPAINEDEWVLYPCKATDLGISE